MRTFPILAVLFFTVPLIEIYLLIQVGHVIGALPTILLVIATSILGAYLLKQQGLSTLARFQNNLRQGQLPATEIKEGVFILIGGLLLMTPGFFTDFLGLFFLLP
ncbi:MAG TPA: FxsA family protein, partial [Thiolinea sp.]|nr:FxsA family protein [Thiolinea sp.]